jgi:hypothetical protein
MRFHLLAALICVGLVFPGPVAMPNDDSNAPPARNGCVTQLIWASMAAGVLTAGAYFLSPRSSVLPAGLAARTRTTYSPTLSREDKYFAVLDAAQWAFSRDPDLYRQAITQVEKFGIRVPQPLQSRAVGTRNPLLGWIQSNDSDSAVRSLANQMDFFGRFSKRERVEIVRRFLGDSIPDYSPDRSPEDRIRILVAAAKKGFSPKQRRALLAVEFGEGESGNNGIEILSDVGLVALYLRMVPGLLESVADQSPADAEAWFRLASEQVARGDRAIAEQIVKVKERHIGMSNWDRLILEKLGHSVVPVWLEMKGGYFIEKQLKPIVAGNPKAYVPEIALHLTDPSPTVIFNALGLLNGLDPEVLRPLCAKINKCLEHPNEGLRGAAVYIIAANDLFSPNDLIHYLDAARSSSTPLATALDLVSEYRQLLSSEERKKLNALLDTVLADPATLEPTKRKAAAAAERMNRNSR